MSELKINHVKKLSYENVIDVLMHLEAWIKHQKQPKCILDLSIIEYIDSAGVAMLVELCKLVRNRYQKSIEIKVSPMIRKMLKFYDVENLLDVCNEC